MSYYNKIEKMLQNNLCPNRLKVEFALYCAEDLDKYYDIKKYPKVFKSRQKALALVKGYLANDPNVTAEKLKATYAANAAAYAAYAATYAAATYAAYAAAAYVAANTAASAAYYAASAAYVAANTAASAANAAAAYANVDKEITYKQQYKWLLLQLKDWIGDLGIEIGDFNV